MKNNSCSGNAVVFILLGVLLFAGLAYTFMRGGKEGQGNMTTQQANIAAGEFINAGTDMEHAINKLLQRGCSETQLNFANTTWTTHGGSPLFAPGHNPNAPATGCGVFASDEGGMQPAIMPRSSMYNWTAIAASNTEIGHARIYRYMVPGIGSSTKEELVLTYPTVRLDVCRKINDIMGIPNPTNDVPSVTATTTVAVLYNGTFTDTNAIVDGSGAITGKTTFCSRTTASPWSISFHHVLIQR